MEQLLANLYEQLTLIQSLTETTRQERECITAKDSPGVERCRLEKVKLQGLLSILEETRHSLSSGRTLRELADLPGTPSEQLLQLRHQMKNALRELQNENDTNMLLLKHELAYIKCFREAILSEAKSQRYTKNGIIAPQLQNSVPVVSMLA